MSTRRIGEHRRVQADAGLVGPHRVLSRLPLWFAVYAAEELIGARLVDGPKLGQRAQHPRVGAKHDIDIGMRQQDGAHCGFACFLVGGHG